MVSVETGPRLLDFQRPFVCFNGDTLSGHNLAPTILCPRTYQQRSELKSLFVFLHEQWKQKVAGKNALRNRINAWRIQHNTAHCLKILTVETFNSKRKLRKCDEKVA